ncbi:MAG: DUF2207 domain-containing protein, partial [Flavobacterium sp.]
MFLKKIFFVLFAVLFYQAQAQEKILNFDVKVQIEKSGKIQVIENITIKAEGDVFKHGLLRVLPLVRKDKDGNQIDVGYSINAITKDGNTANYFTKEEGNEWKLYIGDKDVELESGIYKYQINYSVPFQIGYFDHYDELYWNVTGNGWDFPIDKATCQFYLPSDNRFENLHCYTGLAGSTSSNCISSLNDSKTIVSFSTVNLKPNEGLTVAASFAKGVVDPPTMAQKSSSYYKLIKGYLWSGIFLIAMALFFFFSWRKHGKDPVQKTTIPEFLPPFDWSPAIAGYVYHRATKQKTYMASLINAAVKGAVKISSTVESGVFINEEVYELEILNKDLNTLSPEESGLLNQISKKGKIKVNNSNYKLFEKAYSRWSDSVTKQLKIEEYYQNNTSKKWIGFAVFLIGGLTYEVLSKDKEYINYTFYFGLIAALTAVTYWLTQKVESNGLSILRGFLTFFIFAPAVGIFFMTFFFLSALQMMIIGVAFVMFIFYVRTLGKFTEKGAEALHRLEGFKLYLETAEKDRMNMLNPPELTPQLFEQLFPYAIALDVEVEWGKQFERVLELSKYNPDWYQGDDPFYTRPNVFLLNFRSSVSKASVDPTPKSSSSSSS